MARSRRRARSLVPEHGFNSAALWRRAPLVLWTRPEGLRDNLVTARKSGRVFAWLCLVAIVLLSLVQPSWRPVVMPHHLEHAAIFALTGLAVGLGYPNHGLRNMLLLTIFAGAIELAQLYAPGRH